MTMATFTTKDIQALRARTGAGMMDCKKALEETGGDVEKAIEYLRKKGIAKAEKRAGRAASEGRIVALVHETGRHGALIEVNSETDFVARNEEFIGLARNLAEHLLDDDTTDEIVKAASDGALMKQPWRHEPAKTVEEVVKEASGKIGENVVLRRYARFASDGVIGSYVHHNGRIAVMVEVGGGSGDAVTQLANTVAEHIAAGVPRVPEAVTRDDVPADFVARERRIFEEEAQASGKPANIVQKMVDGRIEKLHKEIVLLEQPWVRDDSKSIGQLVSETSKETRSNLVIRRFARFQMGEE